MLSAFEARIYAEEAGKVAAKGYRVSASETFGHGLHIRISQNDGSTGCSAEYTADDLNKVQGDPAEFFRVRISEMVKAHKKMRSRKRRMK